MENEMELRSGLVPYLFYDDVAAMIDWYKTVFGFAEHSRYTDEDGVRNDGDGSRYRVVNVMYEPGELESLIEAEGWTTEIRATSWFIFGSAGRL
jgi:catechol 2,3-dioxygenase-like lactoylglutathione lyase family enzyme